MAIGAIMAGITGASALANYLTNRANRTPKFRNTGYGRYLDKVRKQGAIAPEMMSQITGDIGNVAQGRQAATRGYLHSRGMGDSIAGARLLDAPNRDLQQTVGNITAHNQQSKIAAGKEYAIRSDDAAGQRRMENRQAVGGLVQGLMQAPMAYLQGREAQAGVKYSEGIASQADMMKAINKLIEEGKMDEARKLFQNSFGANAAPGQFGFGG